MEATVDQDIVVIWRALLCLLMSGTALAAGYRMRRAEEPATAAVLRKLAVGGRYLQQRLQCRFRDGRGDLVEAERPVSAAVFAVAEEGGELDVLYPEDEPTAWVAEVDQRSQGLLGGLLYVVGLAVGIVALVSLWRPIAMAVARIIATFL